jgi:chromosome segregation ATPase
MGYLINQIIFCLLVALIIGFIIGWIWQTIRLGRKLNAMEMSWHLQSDSQISELKTTRQLLEAATSRLEELKTASSEIRQKLTSCETSLDRHDAAVQSLQKSAEGMAGDLHSLSRSLGEQQGRVSELASGLQSGAVDVGGLRKELGDLRQLLEARAKEQRELAGAVKGLPQMSARIEECGRDLKELESQQQTKNERADGRARRAPEEPRVRGAVATAAGR